jgi:hypothetical protein
MNKYGYVQNSSIDGNQPEVSRLSRTDVFSFPNSQEATVGGLEPLFQMIWKAKEIMKLLWTDAPKVEVVFFLRLSACKLIYKLNIDEI